MRHFSAQSIFALTLLSLTLGFVGCASALESKVGKNEIKESHSCENSNTEQELWRCTKQLLESLEKQTEVLEQKLIQNYSQDGDADKARALKRAQLAWKQSIKADCDFYTWDSRDGSGFSSIYNNCLIQRTRKRISLLREVLDSP